MPPASKVVTDADCKNAKPRGEKPWKLSVGSGLYLEVFPDGARRWRWKYRFAGKEKRLALGVYDGTPELAREHWATATPIRAVFRQAFEQAGLPYYPPHSFRRTLVQMGERMCRTPEEFKAWSVEPEPGPRGGDDHVLLLWCRAVSEGRQGDIIRALGAGQAPSA